jgi:hypothetical protein
MVKPTEELRRLLEKLPDDVSYQDIQYHIYVQQAVQRGIDATDQGRVVSQAEVEERMRSGLASAVPRCIGLSLRTGS